MLSYVEEKEARVCSTQKQLLVTCSCRISG